LTAVANLHQADATIGSTAAAKKGPAVTGPTSLGFGRRVQSAQLGKPTVVPQAGAMHGFSPLTGGTKRMTTGHGASCDAEDAPDIFISLRFCEASAAGEILKAKLEARGLSVFLCSVDAGGDLFDEIVGNIDRCRLVVILGTKTYGKDTGVGFCTADELKFIVSEKKAIYLVKMCERFDEALTRFSLGNHVAFHEWMPTGDIQQRSIPEALVDAIVKKLENCKAPLGD
jgi:hypothetical protein